MARKIKRSKKSETYIPPSKEAAVLRGYLHGRVGTRGYQKRRKGEYAAEGTTDARKEAKKLGVDISNPRRALKRISGAGVQYENLEDISARMKDKGEASKAAAKARRENKGRK